MGDAIVSKKPKKSNLLKGMTPRQVIAIKQPVVDSSALPDPSMRRRNGNIGSILSFDVARINKLENPPEDVVARAVDGWFAVWHGRVTAFDPRHVPIPLDDWDKLEIAMAEGIIMRLVSSVGLMAGRECQNGSDLKSIHVYKWATRPELKLATHLLGKTFTALEAKSDV